MKENICYVIGGSGYLHSLKSKDIMLYDKLYHSVVVCY